MSKKRISAAIAGVALAASLAFVPQAGAQNSIPVEGGTLVLVQTQQEGEAYIFVPTGQSVLSPEDLAANGGPGGPHNSCATHNAEETFVTYNVQGAREQTVEVEGEKVTYYMLNANCFLDESTPPTTETSTTETSTTETSTTETSTTETSTTSSPPTTEPTEVSSLGGSAALGLSGLGSAALGSAALSSGSSQGSSDGPAPGDGSADLSSGSSDDTPPTEDSSLGGSAALGLSGLGSAALGSAALSSGSSQGSSDGPAPGDGSADLSSGSSDDTPPTEDSSLGGSAALGLSGLAGSALLSSGSSDGSSNDQAPAPTTTPAAPAAPGAPAAPAVPGTPGQGGKGDFVDHKAMAQQQAENAKQYAPAKQQAAPAKAAPAAQQQAAAPAQAAQQKQLANTGVEGTMIALAVGLIAAAAGAGLLVLRRRSA
ncbi:hypothetical protein B840_00040 [Corynebacterium marinum DSM 44953]|uniref:Gram-positive cocci surface proteins LPxTG domain-containing protein n=2 Tax=Corynebacterium marinum TaxID=349751 RepID=A0A0B6TI54_9CORY|nr:hypothetical protein B840_00040 [Corynebacterium marinum DSM 44953]